MFFLLAASNLNICLHEARYLLLQPNTDWDLKFCFFYVPFAFAFVFCFVFFAFCFAFCCFFLGIFLNFFAFFCILICFFFWVAFLFYIFSHFFTNKLIFKFIGFCLSGEHNPNVDSIAKELQCAKGQWMQPSLMTSLGIACGLLAPSLRQIPIS